MYTKQFIFILDKSIYVDKDLMNFLGKYINIFERYIEQEEFGTKKSIIKIKKDANPLADKIGEIIKREIDKIR